MATRPLQRRVELRWIVYLVVGALCGVLLVLGIDALLQGSTDTSEPLAEISTTYTGAAVGGRLGGITSSDTANDFLIRQGLSTAAITTTSSSAPVGGRLGGIDSADTPTDALFKQQAERIVGPGEGLNQVP